MILLTLLFELGRLQAATCLCQQLSKIQTKAQTMHQEQPEQACFNGKYEMKHEDCVIVKYNFSLGFILNN